MEKGKKKIKKRVFKKVTDEKKEQLMKNRKSDNTNKATKQWMGNFQEYLERNGHGAIETIETDNLPEILLDYYTSVRKMKTVDIDENDPEQSLKVPTLILMMKTTAN